MPELLISNLRGGYVDLVEWVLDYGSHVSPRGQATKEIQGALVEVTNPFDTLPIGINRGISTGIAAVETCQLLAGVSRPKLVVDIGPNFENYREDNGEFHGAYGPRTRSQFEIMIYRLRQDPDTRQAVTTIWDKNYDLLESKKDYPCTLSFTFHIREGRLNMRTHMRSNDVIKGVGYDFFQFSRVQIALASVLGIQPGAYFHYADSMHLYETDLELAGKLRYPTIEDDERFRLPPAFTGNDWDEIQRDAEACLNVAESEDMKMPITETQAWYAGAMINATIRTQRERKLDA